MAPIASPLHITNLTDGETIHQVHYILWVHRLQLTHIIALPLGYRYLYASRR